jgi:hypothetical protein
LKAFLEGYQDAQKGNPREGRVIYSNKAKIAVHYVLIVDDLPGYFCIFVP